MPFKLEGIYRNQDKIFRNLGRSSRAFLTAMLRNVESVGYPFWTPQSTKGVIRGPLMPTYLWRQGEVNTISSWNTRIINEHDQQYEKPESLMVKVSLIYHIVKQVDEWPRLSSPLPKWAQLCPLLFNPLDDLHMCNLHGLSAPVQSYV